MTDTHRPPLTFLAPSAILQQKKEIERAGYEHPIFSWSIGCWILKTYYELKRHGYACALSDKMPKEGIVIGLRSTLPTFVPPARGRFLVSIRSDRTPHLFCQAEVLQNPSDTRRFNRSLCIYVPHWPQHRLIRRAPERGNRVQTVCYFGVRSQMAKELLSTDWIKFLEQRGLRWRVIDANQHLCWGDYTNVDVVVCIRDFSDNQHFNKPATKIYNAWLAGCVPIGSRESSHIALGRIGTDFPVARSYDELKEIITELATDSEKFEHYRCRGAVRASDFSVQSIAHRWIWCLDNEIVPAYRQWRSQGRLSVVSFAFWGMTLLPVVIGKRASGAVRHRCRRVVRERSLEALQNR